MRARKAKATDAEAIARLIEHYATEGLLLPRSREEIRAGIDRFLVLVEGERAVGCVALESYGPDLAEIRSVALDPAERGHGLGARLLRAAMAEARRRGYARVFAVTHAPGFFLRHGFQPVDRRNLKEKIERDCAGCPRSAGCHLAGVEAPVAGRIVALPVLNSKPAPLGAP